MIGSLNPGSFSLKRGRPEVETWLWKLFVDQEWSSDSPATLQRGDEMWDGTRGAPTFQGRQEGRGSEED